MTTKRDIFAEARAMPFSKLLGIEHKNLQITCPFPERHAHGDVHKSARYYPDKNRVKCFAEDRSWSPVDYVAEKLKIEPLEAARLIVEKYSAGGVDWLQDRIKRQMEAVRKAGDKCSELLYDGLEASCDCPSTKAHVAAARRAAREMGTPGAMLRQTEEDVKAIMELEAENDGTEQTG